MISHRMTFPQVSSHQEERTGGPTSSSFRGTLSGFQHTIQLRFPSQPPPSPRDSCDLNYNRATMKMTAGNKNKKETRGGWKQKKNTRERTFSFSLPEQMLDSNLLPVIFPQRKACLESFFHLVFFFFFFFFSFAFGIACGDRHDKAHVRAKASC